MQICYNKLWKLLIDKGWKKKDLAEKVMLSGATMAKLSKNEPVNMDVLLRICETLNVDVGDILEFKKSL